MHELSYAKMCPVVPAYMGRWMQGSGHADVFFVLNLHVNKLL